MRAVIQRVSAADVVVNGGAPRAIGRGLMILLGVRDTDTLDVCEKLAQKCAGLRIFEDAGGKLNVSAGLRGAGSVQFHAVRRYEKGQETQFHRRGKAAAFGGGV